MIPIPKKYSSYENKKKKSLWWILKSITECEQSGDTFQGKNTVKRSILEFKLHITILVNLFVLIILITILEVISDKRIQNWQFFFFENYQIRFRTMTLTLVNPTIRCLFSIMVLYQNIIIWKTFENRINKSVWTIFSSTFCL